MRFLIFTGLILAIGGCSNSAPTVAVDPPNQKTHPALPNIPDRTFNLKDFGGIGDGKTWNTEAFRKALAAVEKQGGGRLIVPAGLYRTGPIVLCSGLDLHLDAGAIIQDYPGAGDVC
jgi:polygalacturonase